MEFVQDNHSRSRRGIVRGMHYQPGRPSWSAASAGAIFDVIVDIRRGSPSSGIGRASSSTTSTIASSMSRTASLTASACCREMADVTYKVSTYYDPQSEGGFAYDDPDVAIAWPEDVELWPRDAGPRRRRLAGAALRDSVAIRSLTVPCVSALRGRTRGNTRTVAPTSRWRR